MNTELLLKGPRYVKIIVIGDELVGKTCLLKTYLTREFPKDYEITIFERYYEDITVDGDDYQMALWDLVSSSDYEGVRKVAYEGAQCALICYAVNNRNSLENVVSYWLPEIQQICPNICVILVATKIDLRDQDLSCISRKEGKKLKKQIGAATFTECSAIQGLGLKNIFVKAIKLFSKEEKCKVS